jgi:2-desacetyl-2-hydroxyethyl bacteriochlorophyllide A dehydrogenase
MKNLSVTFTARDTVALRETELERTLPTAREVLVESEFSVISPGTELTCLNGENDWWFTFPGVPGYASVGRIIAVGDAVDGHAVGDRVLTYGGHQKYNLVDTDYFLLPVDADIAPRLVPLTRLATVAFTALRVSDIELGDVVGVVGLGPVGNLAAQLAQLQGAQVIGLELSARRRELAQRCGIRTVVDPRADDVAALVESMTGGSGLRTLIDTSGKSAAIIANLPLIGRLGELILLGSPRGEHHADTTEILNHVHLIGNGSVTFKGAHEHRYPKLHDPFVKHSFARNSRITWQLLRENRLHVEPLISETLPPAKAAHAYEMLRDRPDDFCTILFDWRDG